MTEYETKDSGSRATFASGMQRDTQAGKARFDLLIPLDVPYEGQLLTRLAALMARGAEKYDPRNWEKANSAEELERMKASAFRHFMQWATGESDEDHAAATIFNLLAYETTKYKVEQSLKRLQDKVNATLVNPSNLGAPTHTRHPDGSVTEIATGRVVSVPSVSELHKTLFSHIDKEVN